MAWAYSRLDSNGVCRYQEYLSVEDCSRFFIPDKHYKFLSVYIMRHQCFFIILTMLFSMATTNSFAHELEAKNSDGVTIYYVWTNNYTEVGVSFRGNKMTSYENEYSGSVVIPETIKYDGNSYNVTSIEDGAFYKCNGLTSISLPNTIKEIYRYSFEGCDNLTSVHISDLSAWCKIDYMGEPSSTNPLEYAHHLFLNGKEITELNIPSDITSIKKYAFSGAQYITKVTFPKNLTSIGREAFKYSGLTEVNIPDGVTELSFCTFAYSNLIKASIPNSVTVIGEESFKYCVNLESIEIGTGLNKIKYNAFTGCEKLSSVYITDLEAWNNHGQFFDSPFKYGANLYLNGELVTELIIPNTITTINNEIFKNIRSITSVIIPNSVISIGVNAFSGCTNLNSVDISNSVTEIGGGAFSGCSSLASVTIPNSVTEIGGWAFYNCSSLSSVKLSDNISTIDNGTFSSCTNLTSIEIPSKVTSICEKAFSGCTNLTSLSFSNTLNSIGEYAFEDCQNLANFNIPEIITEIREGTFKNCVSLNSVTLPNSITSIGDYAFYGAGLTSINIPENVSIIGHVSFALCPSLTSITIPNSVTSIGGNAFAVCENLSQVVIGSGVAKIGHYAFGNCKKLKKFYCYTETVPEIGTTNNDGTLYDTFTDSPIDQATLYVVDTLIDDYKNANYWNRFGSILGIESSGINDITDDNSNADIFDLRGSKVKNTQKGINIIRGKNGNAKKIVVR